MLTAWFHCKILRRRGGKRTLTPQGLKMLASLIHQHPERSYKSGQWRAAALPYTSVHFMKLQRPESLKDWIRTIHWWNSKIKQIPNLMLSAAGHELIMPCHLRDYHVIGPYFAQQNCVPLQFGLYFILLGIIFGNIHGKSHLGFSWFTLKHTLVLSP